MKRLAILCCALLLSLSAIAQDTFNSTIQKPKWYSIETIEGTVIAGTVVSEDDIQIVLNTKSLGLVTIMRNKIKTLKEINEDSFVNGVYWFENPNATRYLIGPSALTLKKGEGYYQNLYLFVQSFEVGITDQISIGGGTEIASVIFSRKAPSLFFLTPKIGFDVAPKLKLGAGILYINANGLNSGKSTNFGIVYGLATAGTLNDNFTLGLGMGYYNIKTTSYLNQKTTEMGFSQMPFITFSGMTRMAKRFVLTTENWLIPLKTNTNSYDYQFIVSYGMRFIGEQISVDFGFINNKDIVKSIFIGIPYIDFVVKFGGNKKK